MVTYQTTGYATQQIPCPKCGKRSKSRKGKHQIVFSGRSSASCDLIVLASYHCECCSKNEYRSFSPLAELLTDRMAPELACLESKFAALDLLRLHRRCANRQAADQYHALLHNPHVSCYPNLGAPAMT